MIKRIFSNKKVEREFSSLVDDNGAPIPTRYTQFNECLDDLNNKDKELQSLSSGIRRKRIAGKIVDIEDCKQTAKYPKKESDEKLIKEALNDNQFVKTVLPSKQLQAVVDSMYSRKVKLGEIIIQEDTVGSQLYISASGRYEITNKGILIDNFEYNQVFGELAILYNEKRQATIKALTSGLVWVLEQTVYQKLIFINEVEDLDQKFNFLKNIPVLNTAPDKILRRVADLLKSEFFKAGSVIIRQGDVGDKFYIINAGGVTVTKDEGKELGRMTRGEFFGQLALINDEVRQATVTADAPGVECFSLSRQEFLEHFEKLDDIGSISTATPKTSVDNPYQNIELSSLKIVHTLGVGGFGRVELVQHKKQKKLLFALKYLKKIRIVEQGLQEHVYNEKMIQINCSSPFIARLYKTYRDNKYVYFLMEPCLAGDLFSLLGKQKRHKFDEPTAQFYAACILEGLAYLHERNIVYRDLKPENILLDEHGYLKLTDFGFAIKLDSRDKAIGVAGTIEYLAPEVISNRLYDRAVDYWALGIFIFELLVGRTPFRNRNDETTCQLILSGIEQIVFPEIVSKRAQNLIRKLCKYKATERLGCQKNGADAVREHKWFVDFEWNDLRLGQLQAPLKREIKRSIENRPNEYHPRDTEIPPDELSGWDKNF